MRGNFLSSSLGRSTVALAASILVLAPGPGNCGGTGTAQVEMTEIYAANDWYQERQEPEREWRGEFHRRDEPEGPGSRGGLAYVLITSDREIPVYAAGVREKLAAFVGERVIARGKLVDLSAEGFGPELWIGAIGRLDAES